MLMFVVFTRSMARSAVEAFLSTEIYGIRDTRTLETSRMDYSVPVLHFHQTSKQKKVL